MNFTWEDALKSGGVSATTIALLGIGYKLLSRICGHRVRSECCGHEATAAVSVEVVEPKPRSPAITPLPAIPEIPTITLSGQTTPVPRSARPSLETKVHPIQAVVVHEPTAAPEALPTDIQARL